MTFQSSVSLPTSVKCLKGVGSHRAKSVVGVGFFSSIVTHAGSALDGAAPMKIAAPANAASPASAVRFTTTPFAPGPSARFPHHQYGRDRQMCRIHGRRVSGAARVVLSRLFSSVDEAMRGVPSDAIGYRHLRNRLTSRTSE
jgi:hypothetical protein